MYISLQGNAKAFPFFFPMTFYGSKSNEDGNRSKETFQCNLRVT